MADIKNHASLTTSLISYWDLEETSPGSVAVTRYDLHGGNNLTDNNSTASSASGKIGQCADFNASNSESLSITAGAIWGYNSSGGSANTNLSASFWFKPDALTGTVGLVGYYTGASDLHEWLVYHNGTSLVLLVRNQGASITWAGTLSIGTWYHVVVTMNSSNQYQLIVNNGTPGTGSGAGGSGSASCQFRIGAYGTSPTGFFDGLIEEVGIWSKVLSSQEITDLYNSGSGLPYYDPTDIKNDATLSTSLVSYWKLDETSGNRADSHGSNTLTDTNTVLYGTGKINNCADLEYDNNEYFAVGDNASLDPGTGYSWSIWFNLESEVNSFLFSKYATGQQSYAWHISSSGGADYLRFYNSSETTYDFTSPFQFSTATWYHVVVTYSSGTVLVYVNGIRAGGSASVGTLTNTSAEFRIGSLEKYANNQHDGLLDEACIYSKALTIAEVRALYGYGTPPEYEYTAPGGSTNTSHRLGRLPLLGVG
jgi:hypothetical protein